MTNKTKEAKAAAKAASLTKIDQVIELLRREGGATLAELTGATGWQPHSVRAVLTGLKKKGHSVERTKCGEESCYCIAEQG